MSDTLLTVPWESKLAKRLEFAVALLAILIVCQVAREEDLSWVAWALAGIATFVVAAARWPYGAVLVLVLASAMPRFAVELFGWKVRPEHFTAGIVSLTIGIWLLFNKRRVPMEKLDYWILGFLAINFASSAFGSPLPSSTLRWALQNSLAVLPYFLVRILVRDLKTLTKAFPILLGIGLVEATFGIMCSVSHHLFGTSGGMEIGAYLFDVAATYGTMYEPNLFGAYTACSAVMFLAQYLTSGRRHRYRYLLCSLICSLATFLSYSRAALIAMVLGSGWVFWRTRRDANWNRNKILTLTLAGALIFAIAFSAIGGVLQERFGGLYYQGFAEDTTLSRLVVLQEALQEVPKHLFLGSGTASFNLSFDWAGYVPEWAGSPTWIANAPLRILHDTGLFGLATIVGFLFAVWRKIRSGLSVNASQNQMLLGLTAGTLVYFISFQSTDGSILAFLWVHLGFLASAAIVLNRSVENATSLN
jgi:O-antigen ligase